MNMKTILLFSIIVAANVAGCDMNAYTIKTELTQDEKLQLDAWVEQVEKGSKDLFDYPLNVEKMAQRIKAVNTPEYKAKEQLEERINDVYVQLNACQCENPTFIHSLLFKDCRKQEQLTSEIRELWKQHRILADAATSTPEYNAWYYDKK